MEYKGFKIEVEKVDEGGYSVCSYRINDNWILTDEWNPSIRTKKEAIEECKTTIDDYLENPDDYED